MRGQLLPSPRRAGFAPSPRPRHLLARIVYFEKYCNDTIAVPGLRKELKVDAEKLIPRSSTIDLGPGENGVVLLTLEAELPAEPEHEVPRLGQKTFSQRSGSNFSKTNENQPKSVE